MRGGSYLTTVAAVALCVLLTGCNTELIRRTPPPAAAATVADETPSVTASTPAAQMANEESARPSAETGAAATGPVAAPESAPRGDAWQRIRHQFALTVPHNTEVAHRKQWYREHPRYLRGVAARARPYLHHIANEIERRGLPGELALLPILESGYRTDVASPYGAAGLWQFMGGTGAKFGLEVDRWYDWRMDVVRSTGAALDYLTTLNQRFDGDWLKTIAAYNAGWGNLEKTIATQRRLGRRTDFWALPLRRETRTLVARLVALAEIFAQPEEYGLELESVPDDPYFEVVRLAAPTDLRRFHDALGGSKEEFFQLNAAWRTKHTPHAGATLYVPVDRHAHAETLAVAGVGRADPPLRVAAQDGSLAAPAGARAHRVRSGESLWTIARRYNLGTRQLAAANGLTTQSTLQIGQRLRIPAAATATGSSVLAERGRRTSAAAVGAASTLRYRVKAGDSLWTISRQFKVTVQQLIAWNGLDRERQLQPGQELLVRQSS